MEGYPVVVLTGGQDDAGAERLCAQAVRVAREPGRTEPLQSRPREFFARFPDGAVLDEIQRAPELPSYLQGIVDADGRALHPRADLLRHFCCGMALLRAAHS